MSSTGRTIACFGATGGCVAAALADALKQGYYCTALVRSADKLRNILRTEHNVPSDTIDQYLTIFEGDAKSPETVAKSLVNPRNPELLVDVILSGIGSYPTFQWSIRQPFPLRDPHICETAVGAIYSALSALSSPSKNKPLLAVISTAGCGRSRGIPLPIYLPYHYLLGSPLADKKRMENLVLTHDNKSIRDFVILRPLFLTNGDAKGSASLRVGWEWGNDGGDREPKEPGPVLGYSVSKRDVGAWAFENIIARDGWEGRCVYLTY